MVAIEKKPEARRLLSAEAFERAKPEEVKGAYVTKADFFKLTPLKEINGAENCSGPAEQTYGRWVSSGRVKEEVEVVEDPTGIDPDRSEVFVPARFVNAERRRANVNARVTREAQAMGLDTRPLAARR
jgi:hypothetical protein